MGASQNAKKQHLNENEKGLSESIQKSELHTEERGQRKGVAGKKNLSGGRKQEWVSECKVSSKGFGKSWVHFMKDKKPAYKKTIKINLGLFVGKQEDLREKGYGKTRGAANDGATGHLMKKFQLGNLEKRKPPWLTVGENKQKSLWRRERNFSRGILRK